MDWLLSISTLFVNAGLGWTKGKWWMWLLHSLNAIFWVYYSFATKQYGFLLLSTVTIIIDWTSALVSAKGEK